MELERVLAANLRTGDMIDIDAMWWFVSAVEPIGTEVDIELRAIDDDQELLHRFAVDDMVVRGGATAVHHKDEFLGMTRAEARAWAAALGWPFRDHSDGGWFTDDLRRDRVNVWSDETGRISRVEFG